MKIVLADDEYLVRESLKSMLLELGLPVEIVGEAVNGEELVRLVNSCNPDIAFVDIRMPRLGGLEAIKLAKNSSPDTQWVILTGFSEFDYAKEAIRLGAASYLLKPVSPEELQEVFDVLLKRNKEYVSLLNKEFENELTACVHDLTELSDEKGHGFISKANFMCSLFLFDSYLSEKNKSGSVTSFYNEVRTIISDISGTDSRIALFPMPSGELASAGAWNIKAGERSKNIIRTYFEKVTSLAEQFSNDEFAITLLQSDKCSSLLDLRKSLYQLQNLSSLRTVAGRSRRLNLGELELLCRTEPPEVLDLSGILIRLASAFSEKVYLNYVKALEDMERLLFCSKPAINNIKAPMADFLLHSMNCRIDISGEPKAWFKALREHGEGLLAESRREESQSSDTVSQLMAFVDANYMHDISIGQIAEQLNLTPNYLSSLFHRKMGTTFIKYLTRVRMLRAKELLANPSVQVRQAAEKVGYFSTRHFSKLFKEFYGYYPSDHRDR